MENCGLCKEKSEVKDEIWAIGGLKMTAPG
jgi:hypothetical protein